MAPFSLDLPVVEYNFQLDNLCENTLLVLPSGKQVETAFVLLQECNYCKHISCGGAALLARAVPVKGKHTLRRTHLQRAGGD